ncbi:N-6 DNA methylase [Candidatus Oscillochloris fontis]|uniref:N-6 DNA methylase n=1 Tax=Candidatus Oscillochloris fontis TaxID=2496868 RepID=UPI00101C4A9D|nr:N-6 DNA methylase [Candidatus Oscillochloris fontis]
MVQKKSKAVWEFGDFQTPNELALEVANVLYRYDDSSPLSVIEPTCGKGSLLIHALKVFPQVQHAIGADINDQYLEILQKRIVSEDISISVNCIQTNFFTHNWSRIIDQLPTPILIIGNPPWVTSSELSAIQSTNLPGKSNFQGYSGLEAITGKSNFDISEWMLLQNIKWLKSKNGTIAMLCKTIVARKVLLTAWKNNEQVSGAKIFRIDAKKYFDASVDACLFLLEINQGDPDYQCEIFNDLSSLRPESSLGYRNKTVIPHVSVYDELSYLLDDDSNYVWRSGIKHDCSMVMELGRSLDGVIARDGTVVDIEEEFLFPMLKSSDVGNNRLETARKLMLVTQTYIGEDTSKIKIVAPKTWAYLQHHRNTLVKRASSIYKGRPDFSIFGVGDYTFSNWKVAISGFYKKLQFVVVGPMNEKPVVFDDTIYFLPCSSEDEARFIAYLLQSEIAMKFYHSLIFWEDKRPITVDVLKKLNLHKLAKAYGEEELYRSFVTKRSGMKLSTGAIQLPLLEKQDIYLPLDL